MRGARGGKRERGRSETNKMGGTLVPTELVGIPKVALTSGWDIKNIQTSYNKVKYFLLL